MKIFSFPYYIIMIKIVITDLVNAIFRPKFVVIDASLIIFFKNAFKRCKIVSNSLLAFHHKRVHEV